MLRLFLPIFLCLSSCGYHFGRGALCQNYNTICIPFIPGDDKGLLTAALIKALSIRGGPVYTSHCPELVLKVCLLEPEDEMIGFALEPAPKEEEKKDEEDPKKTRIVVSHEARLTLIATVTLIDQRTCQPILGPMKISTFIDYDFEPDLSRVNFHAFSLGQLEMHPLAQDAAFPALYKLLAEKIVDYLLNA